MRAPVQAAGKAASEGGFRVKLVRKVIGADLLAETSDRQGLVIRPGGDWPKVGDLRRTVVVQVSPHVQPREVANTLRQLARELEEA